MAASLKDMQDALGAAREAALCRELTKKFEEVVRGSLSDVAENVAGRDALKGEIVLVIGPPAAQLVTDADIDAALKEALKTQRLKDAAKDVAKSLGIKSSDAYARALALKD